MEANNEEEDSDDDEQPVVQQQQLAVAGPNQEGNEQTENNEESASVVSRVSMGNPRQTGDDEDDDDNDSEDVESTDGINCRKRKRPSRDLETSEAEARKRQKTAPTKKPAPPKPTQQELAIRMEGDRKYFSMQELLLDNDRDPIPSAMLFEEEDSSCEEEIKDEMGEDYVRPSEGVVKEYCFMHDYRSSVPSENNVIVQLKQKMALLLKDFSKSTLDISKLMHQHYKDLLPRKNYDWPHMTSYRFGKCIERCMRNDPIVRARMDMHECESMIKQLKKRVMYKNTNGTVMFNNQNDQMLNRYKEQRDRIFASVPVLWQNSDAMHSQSSFSQDPAEKRKSHTRRK